MTRLSLLFVAIAASLASPLTVFAQTATAPAAQADKSDLDKVVVTGTRTSTRTVVTSQSPIDIVSAETLQATGTSELATALSRVLPSLNFPRPALTDGTSAIRPAQLRGMSPDQVLVLVNGKRRHTSSLLNRNGSVGRGSAPVDLNTIPMSAIDHVEVLRDGASAQYGSDAIAGVVNVILKGADHGGSLSYTQGKMSAGDGEQIQIAGDAGFKYAGDRGAVHLAAQVNTQEHTNRAGPYSPVGAPALGQQVGQTAFIFGDPSVRAHAISVNSTFKLTDSVELYGWGTTSNRDLTSYAFFRAPGNTSQNIASVYPLGYVPEINNVSKDNSAVIGARGTIGNDWEWDLSYNYGYNHLAFYTRNTINTSIGPNSPHEFYDGALETTQNVVNLDLRKQFNIGTASPLSVAFGAESRYDKWNQSPGELGSYFGLPNGTKPAGAQGFGGFAPAVSGHYHRRSYAIYADAETDITSKLSADAAVRYEHFSDFGSKTSGKLSARYAFTPNFALRGTLSTGFRAPSLPQQYFQTVSTTFIQSVPYEIRTFPATSPIAKALGAEPLKPETSKSASVGLVTQPLHGLFVTVDAYQVNVKDRIVLSSNLTGQPVINLLQSQGIFGVTGGGYFTNAVDTRSRGVDVVSSYRWRIAGNSTLDLTAGYTYASTKITRIAPNPAALQALATNTFRIDRVEIGRIEEGFPRNKVVLSGLWKARHWEASLSGTRYGSVTTRTASNPALDQTYSAKWIADTAVSYKRGGWKFTVGADNLFNTYPDRVIFANSTNGQLPYSSFSPFGFNGRYVYGKIGFTW